MEKRVVDEWIKYATNDFEAAKILLADNRPKIEIICFLCQQAAEKILKAYLYAKDIEPPKTHDLNFLVEMCIKEDINFEEVAGICERLTEYGVLPRYPFGAEVEERDMRLAIEDARKILEFVKGKI